MLSGKAIFADEDVYAGYRKRRHADQLVREALEPLAVPPPVIQLLTRALEFDPKRRLARVEELASELATALEPATDEEPSLPPASEPSPQPVAPPPTGAPPAVAPPVVAPPQATAPPTAKPPEPGPPPPVTHPAPPTSASSWALPPTVRPWMAVAAAPQGTPRLLPLSDLPQPIGDRRAHYVHATNEVADLIGSHNSKIRVTFLSGPTGARVLHLKGMTCFVAHLGGRPSPAVQLDHASDIALVTPRAQEIGHVRVATGTPGMGQTIFTVGSELVGVSAEDCMDAILFDFGPGSEAYFVYTRGRPIPKSRRG
jgi:hypothetical protein